MKTLIINRIKAFQYAVEGLAEWIVKEVHPKIHVLIFALTTLAGVYFGISKGEWLALIVAHGLVLTAEAINSAIESVVDLATSSYHPLAKRAKDIAAGAVLMAAGLAMIVTFLVFGMDVWNMIVKWL